MKGIITTAGPDGRSRVESTVDLGDGGRLWSTPEGPLQLAFTAAGDPRDLGVAPGGVRWSIVPFAAGYEGEVHWTRTLDLITVAAGGVELILDDGPVTLEAGDCVVMTGVRHAWRAGPAGCTLAAIVLGAKGSEGSEGSDPPG